LLERELQRMHRELRQAMEAVESTNEELTTVNTMLAEKIVDVEKANDDLTNLLASTLTPTLFLDRGLRLRQFTPASTALFPLRPGDVGRPIADVVGRAPVDVLLADAQQVLERLVPVERELALGDDRYLQRVLPYRDRDGRVEGVVAAYVDITETTRAQERLEAVQGLTARIEQAREEERARIAREIHDELGATLTGIQMHLRAAFADASARQIELPGPLADVPGLVDSARHAVNRIIGDLRPSVLDHLGVWAAITWYAERVLEPAGIAWQTGIPRALEAIELAPDRAPAIFRIAQEALTNVVRHAGAATVEIRARAEGDALVMEVRDDGRGIAASAAAHARHGVLGMHERARYFGGHLDIAADDAGGTAVMLRMPMRGAPGATR
jgi:signal transduction histidine kinase